LKKKIINILNDLKNKDVDRVLGPADPLTQKVKEIRDKANEYIQKLNAGQDETSKPIDPNAALPNIDLLTKDPEDTSLAAKAKAALDATKAALSPAAKAAADAAAAFAGGLAPKGQEGKIALPSSPLAPIGHTNANPTNGSTVPSSNSSNSDGSNPASGTQTPTSGTGSSSDSGVATPSSASAAGHSPDAPEVNPNGDPNKLNHNIDPIKTHGGRVPIPAPKPLKPCKLNDIACAIENAMIKAENRKNKRIADRRERMDILAKRKNPNQFKNMPDTSGLGVPGVADIAPLGRDLNDIEKTKIEALIKAYPELFKQMVSQQLRIPSEVMNDLNKTDLPHLAEILDDLTKTNYLSLKKYTIEDIKCDKNKDDTHKPTPGPQINPNNPTDPSSPSDPSNPNGPNGPSDPSNPSNPDSPTPNPGDPSNPQGNKQSGRIIPNKYFQEWTDDNKDFIDAAINKAGEDVPNGGFDDTIPGIKESSYSRQR